jgi:hypothetical protein
VSGPQKAEKTTETTFRGNFILPEEYAMSKEIGPGLASLFARNGLVAKNRQLPATSCAIRLW